MRSTLLHGRTFEKREGAARSSHFISNLTFNLVKVNQELWIVLSLFLIAALMNWLVASHRLIVGFYTLPTLFSAYVYGRRHAVLTASASIFIVVALVLTNSSLFWNLKQTVPEYDRWADLFTWAGLLLITAYAMGTLYERKEHHLTELRKTYFGLLAILQQVISNDKETHNHSYRVALYIRTYFWKAAPVERPMLGAQ